MKPGAEALAGASARRPVQKLPEEGKVGQLCFCSRFIFDLRLTVHSLLLRVEDGARNSSDWCLRVRELRRARPSFLARGI